MLLFYEFFKRKHISIKDFQQTGENKVQKQKSRILPSFFLQFSIPFLEKKIKRMCQFTVLNYNNKNTNMHPAQPYQTSNPDYLNTLKLKYAVNKNNKYAVDHKTFLNSYASLRPVNDQLTDRHIFQQRSPLKSRDNLYENNKDSFLNLKKSIISKANFQTGHHNFLKERNSNVSVQKKQDSLMLRHLMADRSLPKFRDSISFQRKQCPPKIMQNQKYIIEINGRQTKRQQEKEMKQNDSPIKLIYDSKQKEEQTSLTKKKQPKAKSSEITHFYKLQREKTTKTINSIDSLLASIRNTLNK